MNTARLVVPALRWPLASEEPYLRLAERGIGGFCVFGGGPGLAALLRRLQEAAPHPLLFAADHEDGVGQHVPGYTVHPAAQAMTPASARLAGMRTAVEARQLGFTMVFAPVCDVTSNVRNPIIQSRAFLDPSSCAPAYIEGAHLFGLRTCAKHFPGHGATSSDSHDDLPRVDAPADVWRRRDLPPFARAIEAGVDAIMTAHIDCPALTGGDGIVATLSRRVMHDLLREEMGFEGLLVTDALLMDGVLQGRSEPEAAEQALAAGCDVLLCPGDLEGVLAAAARAPDPEAALARMAVASELRPDPLDEAAAAAVECPGPLAAGDHPMEIFARGPEGATLASLLGGAFILRDFEGRERSRGTGPGFATPTVAILRPDRAWGGRLVLPDAVWEKVRKSPSVLLFGARSLLRDHTPGWLLWAPGSEEPTLRAAVRKAIGDLP
ncbi:MAG: glycoside hydrolase family 3 N-terminal domain-containing protein [Planctomycetota bacterium]